MSIGGLLAHPKARFWGSDGRRAVMNVEKPEMYEISVKPAIGSMVKITVDGVEHEAEGFEFAAPLGTGLAVRKITRVELVPTEPIRNKWGS
jgi:hypothetical protein